MPRGFCTTLSHSERCSVHPKRQNWGALATQLPRPRLLRSKRDHSRTCRFQRRRHVQIRAVRSADALRRSFAIARSSASSRPRLPTKPKPFWASRLAARTIALPVSRYAGTVGLQGRPAPGILVAPFCTRSHSDASMQYVCLSHFARTRAKCIYRTAHPCLSTIILQDSSLFHWISRSSLRSNKPLSRP